MSGLGHRVYTVTREPIPIGWHDLAATEGLWNCLQSRAEEIT